MAIVFFDDPKKGPRWHGLTKFLTDIKPEKRQDVIDKFCLVYPVWFFEWLTEIDGSQTVFEEFQINYLLDDSRYKITNKTRQAGGSLIVSAAKFYKAYTTPNYRVDIVSVKRDEAQDKIRYAKAFYDSLPRRWRNRELTHNNLERIGFKGYGEMRSIAASAGVRGGRKEIVFDEAHHIERLDELFKAALPATARSTDKNALGFDMLSTPNGMQGKYFEIWANTTGKHGHWSRHEFGWWEVSHFCKDIHKARKRWVEDYQQNPSYLMALRDEFGTDKFFEVSESFTTEEYLQEFCGIFVDDSTAFFSYELIDSCRYHATKEDGGKKGYVTPWTRRPEGNTREVVMGIDFAEGKKGGDSTSIQLFEKGDDDIYRHRFYEDLDYRNQYDSFEKQIRRIGEVIEIFRPTTLRVDETGLGRRIAQEIEEKYGHLTSIEKVTFTNPLKEEMVLNVKQLMERGRLHLQWSNERLKGQIHNMKRTPTAAGHFRYEGKPHDDMFWAMALALKDGARGGFKIIKIFD